MKKINFKIALFGQGTEDATGYQFDLKSGDETMSFIAHKRGQKWHVSHLATGLCVDHGTTSRAETVKGFKDAVECGLFNLAALAHMGFAGHLLREHGSGN